MELIARKRRKDEVENQQHACSSEVANEIFGSYHDGDVMNRDKDTAESVGDDDDDSACDWFSSSLFRRLPICEVAARKKRFLLHIILWKALFPPPPPSLLLLLLFISPSSLNRQQQQRQQQHLLLSSFLWTAAAAVAATLRTSLFFSFLVRINWRPPALPSLSLPGLLLLFDLQFSQLPSQKKMSWWWRATKRTETGKEKQIWHKSTTTTALCSSSSQKEGNNFGKFLISLRRLVRKFLLLAFPFSSFFSSFFSPFFSSFFSSFFSFCSMSSDQAPRRRSSAKKLQRTRWKRASSSTRKQAEERTEVGYQQEERRVERRLWSVSESKSIR